MKTFYVVNALCRFHVKYKKKIRNYQRETIYLSSRF